MAKLNITAFHPNNNGTAIVTASSADTIEAIMSALVDNRFIVGEQYYLLAISNNHEKQNIVEYHKTLDELGVTTDSNLYISHGSLTDYKAPPYTEPSSPTSDSFEQPKRVESDKKTRKPINVNGWNYQNLPSIEPTECYNCKHQALVIPQLKNLLDSMNKNKKLEAECESLKTTVYKLKAQIERKKTAEWLLAFSPIVVGLGTAFITQIVGILVTFLGVGLTIFTLIISNVEVDDNAPSTKRKGKK